MGDSHKMTNRFKLAFLLGQKLENTVVPFIPELKNIKKGK